MLVLFGAADEQPLGDIWSLDLGTLFCVLCGYGRQFNVRTENFKWTCLEARGALPPPRTLSHCVLNSVNGKDRVYVFGGGMAGDIPLNDANVYCLDVGLFFKDCHNQTRKA